MFTCNAGVIGLTLGPCHILILFYFAVTGEKLKCIVIVKAISQFEIQTTTRALYLEDSPEELIIQGYDDAGKYDSEVKIINVH